MRAASPSFLSFLPTSCRPSSFSSLTRVGAGAAFDHGTWRLPPSGYYNLSVAVAVDSVLTSGGGQGPTLPDHLVEPIAHFTSQNETLELQFDASTRATKSIRQFPAEFCACFSAPLGSTHGP